MTALRERRAPSTEERSARPPSSRFAAPAAAALVMLGVGCWGLTRSNAMGNDEVVTRWAAQLPFGRLAHLLRHVDAVHGLYYALMHPWASLLGDDPTTLRAPSLVAMVLAVAVVAEVARTLTGSPVAALAAGLVTALTPSISYYAQTARSYAGVFLCVAALTLLFVHAVRRERSGGAAVRLWVGYGALVTVAGYLNEMSLLVLAAHAVTLLLAGWDRRTATRWFASAAGGAVLVTPLVVVSAREDSVLSFLTRPGWNDVRVLAHDYLGASWLVAALLVACAVLAAWTWRGRGLTVLTVGLPLAIVPAAALMIESLLAHPLYVDRYVLWGEIGVAVLAGAGIARLGEVVGRPAVVLRWAPAVVVCALVLVGQLAAQQSVRRPGSRQFDFGGPAHEIAVRSRSGDAVLFLDAFYRKGRLGYPGDYRKVRDIALARPPAQVGNFRGTDKDVTAIETAIDGEQRIWVVGRLPSTTAGGPGVRAESATLLRRFERVSLTRFKGITVSLWHRR